MRLPLTAGAFESFQEKGPSFSGSTGWIEALRTVSTVSLGSSRIANRVHLDRIGLSGHVKRHLQVEEIPSKTLLLETVEPQTSKLQINVAERVLVTSLAPFGNRQDALP